MYIDGRSPDYKVKLQLTGVSVLLYWPHMDINTWLQVYRRPCWKLASSLLAQKMRVQLLHWDRKVTRKVKEEFLTACSIAYAAMCCIIQNQIYAIMTALSVHIEFNNHINIYWHHCSLIIVTFMRHWFSFKMKSEPFTQLSFLLFYIHFHRASQRKILSPKSVFSNLNLFCPFCL